MTFLVGRGELFVNDIWIKIIIILVLILIIIGIIYYAYRRIRRRIRRFSYSLFGTSSLFQGFSNVQSEYATTPKSVSSATDLYLPSIMRDFPEFHYEEMKERAQNVLVSYLKSIDAQDKSLLTEGTNELKEKLTLYIRSLQQTDTQEHYEQIKIHRTEIHKYKKMKGRCSVVFQSAIEFIHYVERRGVVRKGQNNNIKQQAKFNIELIYIQDQDYVDNQGNQGLGLNCPNCGAPISMLGAKTCEYCDTTIVEFNIRVWNFSDVKGVSH